MTAYELGAVINLFDRVGTGDCQAWIVTVTPDRKGMRFVQLCGDAPCRPGLTFALRGAVWRVVEPLHGGGEGLWSAVSVRQ